MLNQYTVTGEVHYSYKPFPVSSPYDDEKPEEEFSFEVYADEDTIKDIAQHAIDAIYPPSKSVERVRFLTFDYKLSS